MVDNRAAYGCLILFSYKTGRKMTKLFLVTIALILLPVSCSLFDFLFNDECIDETPKTLIVFDNLMGISGVTIYEDPRRRDIDIVARVPSSQLSQGIEWQPSTSTPFYFTYHVGLGGINGFTFDYVPQFGKDQTEARINSNITTYITIPKLEETVSSTEQLLSNNSFIVIQNNSTFPLRLQRGSSIITPDNSNSFSISAGEMAHYMVNPGAVSPYLLFSGALEIPFPDSITNFEAGYVYIFTYENNSISFDSRTELIWKNIFVPGTTFTEQLTWLWSNVQSGETYHFWITGLQSMTSPYNHLDFTNRDNITITLNSGGISTIGSLIIGSGVTLVLNDIAMQTRIGVRNGGTLIMNTGSIREVSNSGIFNMYGGSVFGSTGTGVSNSAGTFNMYGGSIFGNSRGVVNNSGMRNIFNMRGGRIFGNTGTGVQGHFRISNGVINGVSGSEPNNGGAFSGGGQFGRFNADGVFSSHGDLSTTNDTIHVINGVLQ
jgi:hypothetical protein